MKKISVFLTTIGLFLNTSSVFADEKSSSIKYVDTDKAPQYKGALFSQGARIDLRRRLAK